MHEADEVRAHHNGFNVLAFMEPVNLSRRDPQTPALDTEPLFPPDLPA